MHSKKDVFRPSFLCSFKHALLQSLDFVVTGFSYFNRGREVGGGGGGREAASAYDGLYSIGGGGGGPRENGSFQGFRYKKDTTSP